MNEREATWPTNIARLEVLKPSLRRAEPANGAGLIVDIRLLRPEGSSEAAPVVAVNVLRNGTSDPDVEFRANPAGEDTYGTMIGVPVTDSVTLEINFADGGSLRREVIDVGLTTSGPAPASRERMTSVEMWKRLDNVFRGVTSTGDVPASFGFVKTWDIMLSPEYAPVRNGSVYLEDESSVSEELNELVAELTATAGESPERALNIFGNQMPFKTEWSCSGKDISTGSEASVKQEVDESGAVPVQLTVDQSSIPLRATISFADSTKGTPIRVDCSIKILDSLGDGNPLCRKLQPGKCGSTGAVR